MWEFARPGANRLGGDSQGGYCDGVQETKEHRSRIELVYALKEDRSRRLRSVVNCGALGSSPL